MKNGFNKLHPGVVSHGSVGFMGPPDAMLNPTYE